MPLSIDSSPSLFPDERLDSVNESIRLIRKKNGLTFGTDAYLLAAFVRPQSRAVCVDLGSGTGILSFLLTAKRKIRTAYAVEIQPEFADLIGRNASLNGMEESVKPICGDVRDLSPADIGGEADTVVSNPPYLKRDCGKRNQSDENYIARHEIYGSIGDFCAAAARLLRHGGRFYCVYRPDRLSELFASLCECKLEPKRMVLVYADETAEPSSVLMEAVKGAAPSLRVLPPFLLYEKEPGDTGARILTAGARRVYETCSFPESLCR